MNRQPQVPDTEFSEQFVQGMYDRMAVSYYKYGPIKQAYPHRIDALASLKLRLEKYYETSNTEYLMDAANFAMIEFMCPSRADAHYTPTDSDGSPGRIGVITGKASQYKNKDILIDESKCRL